MPNRPLRSCSVVVGLVVALAIPTPAAAHDTPSSPPLFEMPFPCGEVWQTATYPGHGAGDHSSDWNQGSFPSADLNELVVASLGGYATVNPLPYRQTVGVGNGPYGVESPGINIAIDHGGGWITRYLHLNAALIGTGPVERGQAIGRVGESGTESPHLHYEQELNGVERHVTLNGQPIIQSTVYNGPAYRSHNCADGIGVFRPGANDWYLDNEANGSTSLQISNWGDNGDQPVAGDWDGDGGDGIGVYRASTGTWYLDYNNNGSTDSTVSYGGEDGDRPVAGDWDGDGADDIGIYREGVFYLDTDRNGATNLHVAYGFSTDNPLVGDWDGDGDDTVAVFRPTSETVFIDYDNNGQTDQHLNYGLVGDLAVSGDWDGDAVDGVGMYRRSTGTWYLDFNRDGGTDRHVAWGEGGDRPIAGDWRSP